LSIGKNYPVNLGLFGAKQGKKLIFRKKISHKGTKDTKDTKITKREKGVVCYLVD